MRSILKPKSKKGPKSSLNEYPLLFLYFDNFLELQEAARHNAFEIGMDRRLEGSGDYRFEGILLDEKRFNKYWREDLLRLRLNDGTTLCRKDEKLYWDMVEHPENHLRTPAKNPDIEKLMREMDSRIEAIVTSMRLRYGMI